MTTEYWWVLGTGIAIVLALPGLGFAAMSTNPPFTVPRWVPKIFFALSIAVASGEGFYFWHMSIFAQIIAVAGAIGLLVYLFWPFMRRARHKNKPADIVNVTRSENLTDTLTKMNRRLVELQGEKFSHTKVGYTQFEQAMPMLADRIGTIKQEDWARYQRNLKSRIRKASPRRPIPRGSIRRRFIEWVKWKESVRLATLSVIKEAKVELLQSKKWTWKDGIKISDWIDGHHWGVQELRDSDPQWKTDFESISHYLKEDVRLRELITEHIEVSRFYNDACLIARYSQTFPKTSFLVTLHEELVGSPISPINAEIHFSKLLGEIDKRLAEIKPTQLTNRKELFTAIHQLKETAREVISTSNALRYMHEIAKGDPPQSLVTDFAKAVDKHEGAKKALEYQELIAGKAFHNPINEFFTKIQSCIQNPGPLQKQPNSNVVCVNSGEVFNKLNDALNEAIKEIDVIS